LSPIEAFRDGAEHRSVEWTLRTTLRIGKPPSHKGQFRERTEQLKRAKCYSAIVLVRDFARSPAALEVCAMRNAIVVAVLILCGLAIWRPSLRDIGIALVVLALTLIAGVGRLGIGFVRPPRLASKPDPSDEK
jgi:hypothetical protein